MCKICQHCGKPFRTNSSTRYCKECRYIELECYNCGKRFTRSRAMYDINIKNKYSLGAPAVFCSKSCSRRKKIKNKPYTRSRTWHKKNGQSKDAELLAMFLKGDPPVYHPPRRITGWEWDLWHYGPYECKQILKRRKW